MSTPGRPQTYEVNASFTGTAWLTEVDGVPISASSKGELQRLVRAEVVRQTDNERIMVLINFL